MQEISYVKQDNNKNPNLDLMKQHTFFIKKDSTYIKIDKQKIIYLKAAGNTTEIHLQDNIYIFSSNLAFFLKKLNANFIVKINRSYAVNILYIEKFDLNYIYIVVNSNLKKISITDTFRASFMNKIQILKTR